MSLNEYLLGNARARAQEVIDSLDKSLTIIVGITSIGPIALFIFSTLVNPYLSLLIPLFVTLMTIVIRRIFLRFKSRLNSELLSSMNAQDNFASELLSGNGSLIMSILGINDSRKWVHLLRSLYDVHDDVLDSILSRELQGDLSMSELSLARHVLALRYASDKMSISALRRGLRTVMLSYYILLFAIPAVAKSLQFLGIHWNVLFIISIQVIISIMIIIFMRIMRREFNVDVSIYMPLTAIVLSIVLSLILLTLVK
ncbi:hypothetical protein JCM16161A_06460 [Vulcanisaeta sp. JCM 16161]|uniref:hypothetical protein n=1 Tax=Vulcanisaeta sp. JCM 16161 TaxID=1295372 RepID=UPI0006D1275F|nr:hypothetical protein [Vulcanisaeta sp. JCM 16161]